MSQTIETIQRKSGTIRLVVIAITALVIVFNLYQLVFNNQINYFDNALFNILWTSDQVNQWVLLLASAPILLFVVAAIYWVCKLLSLFEKGMFFSHQCFRCFINFIFLKIASTVYYIALTLGVGFWHKAIFGDAEVVLTIDFDELITLGLLAIVAYLLKAAKEIEDENKEFI
ncbi:hypothetical protein N473_18180 [Pseudoalteromonas luteoviolacea CPMOR-1]|uniref:DUF2975 domain-containing protein n=2 Tax=Pseudoalteromonas luteoviolacea TaxID=43657 RepID=A0A0C1MP51_9GAMM|nr:DUF2975 domain-containing protein [Pseudoalteromonas luteoviolacea]KID55630.1 hypothetical protein JF50_14570 [Pseudoalteromonas luteoviolacea]KID56353.1 hypothetical protein JF50_19180 [Pseudoalteromonas luteoviolacea]KZN62843.1 hypothetical protein N473_18180 [Pseudoalteromonas luteoviolacea CPMOR-1]